MSKIKVNYIGTTEGGDEISTNNVIQGTAKAWANLNGTGTIVLRDSFNVSSLVDNGTGKYSINLNNLMANSTYSYAVNGDFTLGTDSGIAISTGDNNSITTGQFSSVFFNSSFIAYDPDGATNIIFGDLA